MSQTAETLNTLWRTMRYGVGQGESHRASIGITAKHSEAVSGDKSRQRWRNWHYEGREALEFSYLQRRIAVKSSGR